MTRLLQERKGEQMEVSVKMTRMFFDRQAVIDAVGKQESKVLGKAGAMVRRSAKGLLVFKPAVRRPRMTKNKATNQSRMAEYRAAKKASASAPGAPPFVRRKQYPNLSSIVYAWDSSTRKVVVGPIERRSRSMERTAPNVHEFGGSVKINVKSADGKIHPMTANYPKRPLMGPALDKVKDQLPKALNSAIGPR